jgi:hypothetical protein
MLFWGATVLSRKALELASACEHPNAVWLTKLFAAPVVVTEEEARRVFLGCENDPRALGFAGFLSGLHRASSVDEMRRAAELGDAFAQAWVAWPTIGEERFRWAEKSAAQGERDGFYKLGLRMRMEMDARKTWKEQKRTI